MRNPFGWDYPPGAEHDPMAPWNQREEHHPKCPLHEDNTEAPEGSECKCKELDEEPDWDAIADERREREMEDRWMR